MTISPRFFILLFIFCASCSKSVDLAVVKNIELSRPSDFGEVVSGELLSLDVFLKNNSQQFEEFKFFSATTEFILTPASTDCAARVSPSRSCKYKLLLRADGSGAKSSKIEYMGETVTFKATAKDSGLLQVDRSAVSFSTIAAGDKYSFSFYITNTGGVRAAFPSFSGPVGFSIEGTKCLEFISSQETCEVMASFGPTQRNHNFSEVITGNYGSKSIQFSLIGSVVAGKLFGNIDFVSIPDVRFGGGNYSISTAVMADSFGNQIEDGESVTVSFYKLLNENGTYGPVALESTNGVFIINFKSLSNYTGEAVISINSLLSSGTAKLSVK